MPRFRNWIFLFVNLFVSLIFLTLFSIPISAAPGDNIDCYSNIPKYICSFDGVSGTCHQTQDCPTGYSIPYGSYCSSNDMATMCANGSGNTCFECEPGPSPTTGYSSPTPVPSTCSYNCRLDSGSGCPSGEHEVPGICNCAQPTTCLCCAVGTPTPTLAPTPVSCGSFPQPCCCQGQPCQTGFMGICNSPYSCEYDSFNSTYCCNRNAPKNAVDACPATACNNFLECMPHYETAFCNGLGISTGIGCLSADDAKKLINELLRWGVGIGGGILFFTLVYAGFNIATAGGDPKKVKAGQEVLIAAIAGLAFLTLSTLILNVVGVRFLGLSNFGFRL